MYTFFSILVICATILVIFFKSPNDFHIIHTYHNYEHLDPERFRDAPETPVDKEDEGDLQNHMKDLLNSVQKATSLMHGGGTYDD